MAKDASRKRICPIDKKEFIPKTPHQKFCSAKCQHKENRKNFTFYNARCEPREYELIQNAAARAGESMNVYIITAALKRAKAA
jgi:predicted HicB family RNase H-like nuclease